MKKTFKLGNKQIRQTLVLAPETIRALSATSIMAAVGGKSNCDCCVQSLHEACDTFTK